MANRYITHIQIIKMKITVTKIIRELEKKGYGSNFLNGDLVHALIANTRNVINEILKEQKGISIK